LPSFFTNKVGEEKAITSYRRRGIPVSVITAVRDYLTWDNNQTASFKSQKFF